MKYVALIALALLLGCNEETKQAPQVQQSNSIHVDTVVFIGDSITVRWNIQDVVPNAINMGLGGQTSCQMLERFQTDVLSNKPDFVVIEGGINDITYLANPSTRCLMDMANQAQAIGARVVVATVVPQDDWENGWFFKDDSVGIEWVKTFNREIKQGAQIYGYTVADYYSVLVKDGRQNESLFADIVHPNEKGYEAMKPVLVTALKQSGFPTSKP